MSRWYFVALCVLILGLVGCDHATKHVAQTELRDQPAVGVIDGVLDFRYTENRDSAFSALRAIPQDVRTPLLLALNGLTLPLVALLWFIRRRSPLGEQLAFALYLAGGIGNFTDRLFRGYVIDFIHLHHWPIFNVADISITVGAILLVIYLYKTKKDEATPEPAAT